MKSNYTFQRIEKKYLLDQNKFNLFFQIIEPFVRMDEHGLNTICNIYYDTDNFELIRSSIEKPKYKEKLRLRSYGTAYDEDTVFLEIKKKFDGTVYKRRIELKLREAENYMENGVRPSGESQILREIDYFINFYKPEKKLYLAYDRVAFYDRADEDLRITFDHNIRSRWNNLSLKSGDYGSSLLDEATYLMEIKAAGAMPLWLARALSELQIYPVSFSKYGSIYKKRLAEISSGEINDLNTVGSNLLSGILMELNN
jgi:hypothetical protein